MRWLSTKYIWHWRRWPWGARGRGAVRTSRATPSAIHRGRTGQREPQLHAWPSTAAMPTATPASQATSDNAPRVFTPSLWLIHVAIALLLAAVTVMAVDVLMHPQRFVIRSVALETPGPYVSPATLHTALQPALRGNYFSVDIKAVRAAAESVPLVRIARVERLWPDALSVHITEHALLARWGNQHVLSKRGQLVLLSTNDLAELAGDLKALPVITTPSTLNAITAENLARDVADYHQKWQPYMQKRNLHIASLDITRGQAWEITLQPRAPAAVIARTDAVPTARSARLDKKNNDANKKPPALRLLAGRSHVNERTARFLAGYDAHLHNVVHQVRHVDLRYPNGFAVRWATSRAAFRCTTGYACIQ